MRFVGTVLLAILAAPPALAAAARPSEQSIRQLFELMHTSAMLDNVMAQIDASARATMLQATAGEPLSEEQERILGDMQARLMSLMREELNWAGLEPMMIEVYRDSFTQKEVDGMLKFYRSDSGQAVIGKMPLVMQGMMQKMQGRMQSLTPRVAQLEKDAIAQLRAAARNSPPPQGLRPPEALPPPAPSSAPSPPESEAPPATAPPPAPQ